VAGIARAEGTALVHVKPHGALYNMAARDEQLAASIARAVRAFDPRLRLVGLAGSALLRAGEHAGLAVVSEAFADRAYTAAGRLVSRAEPGAVIHDPDVVAARAIRLAREGVVASVEGAEVRVRADTICIHGDTPGAAALAHRVRAGLEAAGVRVLSLARHQDPA
jgi:UPF0271 protein